MAKIRVYELARELNMTNKVLIEKLNELDFSVKSHMSSLDEETVDEIKAKLLGKEKTVNVEVTRVRPTVIRRRKKRVVVTQAPEEAQDVEEDVSAEEAPADAEPGEAAAPEPEDAEAPAEAALEETPEPVTEEEPVEVASVEGESAEAAPSPAPVQQP